MDVTRILMLALKAVLYFSTTEYFDAGFAIDVTQ